MILLILLGLTIRLLLIPLPGFKIDVNDWFSWSIRLSEVGLSKFYSNQVFSDYTPGYMYVLYLLGLLKNILRIDNYYFYLLLKLPAILAEIMISILVFKETGKSLSKSYAVLGASFILFNPSLIFNSSIWGQVDSLLTLFLFLAIYYLKNNSLVLSSITLGIAFLIKPQTIAIFPVFALFLLRNFSMKNLAKLALPALLTVFILSLSFFPNKPILGLIDLVLKTTNQYAYTSLFAYNFWGIVGFWLADSQLWNGLSYQEIGYILFFTYWTIIAYFYLKKKVSLYSLVALAALSFFFLPTRVHERYLYPAIVFLIFSATLLKSRLILTLTIFLSLIHFLNLYYVYVYYNELYLKLPKILYNPFLYNLLDRNGKVLSIISTIIFVIITFVIVKILYVPKKAKV